MQEIERKFLVDKLKWKPTGDYVIIKQGYLTVDPERTVRVRISGARAYLTIKGKLIGITRTEMEYKIPVKDAEQLLTMCVDNPVIKRRYTEQEGNLKWEIDVFEMENEGLILAEVELEYEEQSLEIPNWAGREVSKDYRYFNSWLAQKPFSTW